MRIVYYNSGWPINVGNAFIDMGATYQIRQAVPNAELFTASEMPRWFCWVNNIDQSRALDVAELIETDFLVVAGMTLCDEFIAVQGPVLKKMAKRGVKIIFLGASLYLYTKEEIDNFKKFMAEIKPYGFMSRDRESFAQFKDLCPRSYDGIDCAFFVREAFKPAKLLQKDFVVYNFDAMDEPAIDNQGKKIFRTQHACFEVTPNSFDRSRKTYFFKNKWPFIERNNEAVRKYYSRPDMMISDLPEDYLHLFANTHATYSDRVHACIPTLSFGNWARLYTESSRALLFDRAGVADVKDKLVKLDQEKISVEKKAQIEFLRELLVK